MQFTYWTVTYVRHGEQRTTQVRASSRAGADLTVTEMVGQPIEILSIRPA